MDRIWAYMQTSGPYERHHIIAIVRAMAKGHVHTDITLSDAAVTKLQSLGLTVVHLQGAYHRVTWADLGFVGDVKPDVSINNELINKVDEVVKKPASNDDVWRNFVDSMGSTLNTNKNGVGRVD